MIYDDLRGSGQLQRPDPQYNTTMCELVSSNLCFVPVLFSRFGKLSSLLGHSHRLIYFSHLYLLYLL